MTINLTRLLSALNFSIVLPSLSLPHALNFYLTLSFSFSFVSLTIFIFYSLLPVSFYLSFSYLSFYLYPLSLALSYSLTSLSLSHLLSLSLSALSSLPFSTCTAWHGFGFVMRLLPIWQRIKMILPESRSVVIATPEINTLQLYFGQEFSHQWDSVWSKELNKSVC